MHVADRLEGSTGEGPRSDGCHGDHDHIGDKKRERDTLDHGLIGRLGDRDVGVLDKLRDEVEGRREDLCKTDVDHDTEQTERQGKEPDVEDREPKPCAPEHQITAGTRSR